MPDIRKNSDEVQRQGKRGLSFRPGLVIPAGVYVIGNVILGLVWAIIPKAPTVPPLPLAITLGWLVVLIVHAAIVLVSHSPRQVERDEIKREIKEQQLHQTK